jgi:hypothetical protein
LILLGIFPQAQLKHDVPLVRLEDDLRLATFAADLVPFEAQG